MHNTVVAVVLSLLMAVAAVPVAARSRARRPSACPRMSQNPHRRLERQEAERQAVYNGQDNCVGEADDLICALTGRSPTPSSASGDSATWALTTAVTP